MEQLKLSLLSYSIICFVYISTAHSNAQLPVSTLIEVIF